MIQNTHKKIYPYLRTILFVLLGIVLAVNSTLPYTSDIFKSNKALAAAGDGRMIMFFNGATIPTGWTCISCNSGDDFFQRFIKGAATHGSTGGTATHTHTVSVSANASTASNAESRSGTDLADVAHGHSGSASVTATSNLPSYRNLKLIRHNTTGDPTTLPAGIVGIFDTTTLPSGWTRYSAQDTYYARGEGTVGGTGGSNTHTTSVNVTLGASTGTTHGKRGGGTQVNSAIAGHTHTASVTSASSSNEPPYIEVVLADISTSQSMPVGLIAMWDDDPTESWDNLSGTGGTFNGRYIKGASTYGSTGGALTHNHSNTTGITSSGPSATTNARSGSSGASNTHTHSVDVTNYNTLNHEPPYRETKFAKYNPMTKFEQSSYRFFNNDNSTDVGSAIAAQDTAITSPAQGTPFRLRMTVHVSVLDLASSGQNFKLQYAARSGTCDTSFSGETYADVATASGDIRYHDNSTPTDGSALTGNANDPTHGGHTVNDQTYEESNNFTNSQSAIDVDEDGMWDFALVDFSASGETSFCFRIVKSDGTILDIYTVIPQITTPPTPPRMILMYDGGTIPTGWTCISCSSGDDVYQRFVRGENAYGTTGGAATHTHTASGSIAATASGAQGKQRTGSGVADQTHTHTYSPTIGSASNLPAYRQLKIIRYDSGTPLTIPSGAIGLFDAAVPSGWTRYSAQDGNFVRGEGTAGSTGGSNTHSHTITGTTSNAGGTVSGIQSGGTQVGVATDTHNHSVSGSSDSVDLQPPYIETILGKANSSTTIPGSFIAMWDKNPGGSWTCLSCMSGDPLYQKFFKPAATYGTTGGAATHTHANSVFNSAAPTGITTNRTGTANASNAHIHQVTVNNFNSPNHLPPYIHVFFAKSASSNTTPNSGTNLAQEKTDATSLSVGAWTNETSVVFTADVSDTDNPDTLYLCVEAKPLGTAFTNTEDGCGSGVSYSGTALEATYTASGLTNDEEYHWQARVKDAAGAYSSWVSFGANAESARDFGIDTSSPTGTVYDGSTMGVDAEYNNGALDTLDANWDIDSDVSGFSGYEYSIGTTAGATDVVNWTSNGTTASVSVGSLTLETSQIYFFNIRTTDNAGSQSVISSDGQLVAPTLSFSTSGSGVIFNNLNAGNSWTDTETTTITTSTNARNGYVVRLFSEGLLTNMASDTIGNFDGGTYASPDEWLTGDRGYGYTSNDPLIQGVNKFSPATCAGGGAPPCYTPFSLSAPGDIVADNPGVISGTPITNEMFTITHRVQTDATQEAGRYETILILSATADY